MGIDNKCMDYMITKLFIKNFKSVKEAELECSKINVFIGEPNTGKSNILETIALLHLFVDQRKDLTEEELSFMFRISQWSQLFYWENLSHAIAIDAVLEEGEEIPIRLRYNEESEQIDVIYSYSDDRGEITLTSLNPTRLHYTFPAYTNIVRFGFYRFRTRKDFPSKEMRFVVPPDAPNLLKIIRNRREELMIELNRLFSKYGLELILKMSSGAIELQHPISVEGIRIMASLPYTVLSDSLQRMVFNLAIVTCNENMVIALEEPETHTFPFYVKYLAEKIARDEKGNQYFISTHNPYFLISLLEKAPKKDVNVFITSFYNYETKVRMLTDEQKEEILDMGSDVFFNLDKIWEELSLGVER
jgi:AAA15 family ATPase/GTPase